MSLANAIKDYKRFSQAEWSVEISFTTPNKVTTVIVNGLASRHNLSVDAETGIPVNARNVHISVNESVLIDAGYTTRNAAGDVDLSRHIVKWTDATNVEKDYLIQDVMPSDTVGLLVITLGEYDDGS